MAQALIVAMIPAWFCADQQVLRVGETEPRLIVCSMWTIDVIGRTYRPSRATP